MTSDLVYSWDVDGNDTSPKDPSGTYRWVKFVTALFPFPCKHCKHMVDGGIANKKGRTQKPTRAIPHRMNPRKLWVCKWKFTPISGASLQDSIQQSYNLSSVVGENGGCASPNVWHHPLPEPCFPPSVEQLFCPDPGRKVMIG